MGQPPLDGGPFTDPTGLDLKSTLQRKLIPTADKLRDILTKFGMRPYTVKIFRVKWSGGARGVGTPYIIQGSELHLLPTPKMTDLNAVQEIVQPVGLDEIGSIQVSQISGQFTEEQLRGLGPDGSEPPPDEEVFYEIEFLRSDGLPGQRRRFQLRGAPQYYAGRFQWIIQLEKAHEDRSRAGAPEF
jgi:hypothetical protein